MPSLSSVRLARKCDCSTSSMISVLSDAGFLCASSPHPRSELLAGFSYDLLQGSSFAAKVLHLAGRGGAGGVARQPALALKELLGPAAIHTWRELYLRMGSDGPYNDWYRLRTGAGIGCGEIDCETIVSGCDACVTIRSVTPRCIARKRAARKTKPAPIALRTRTSARRSARIVSDLPK